MEVSGELLTAALPSREDPPPRNPLDKRLDRSQDRSERGVKIKESLLPQGLEQ
jgi:hypothetical protein